jgi:hypothetical protein
VLLLEGRPPGQALEEPLARLHEPRGTVSEDL